MKIGGSEAEVEVERAEGIGREVVVEVESPSRRDCHGLPAGEKVGDGRSEQTGRREDKDEENGEEEKMEMDM